MKRFDNGVMRSYGVSAMSQVPAHMRGDAHRASKRIAWVDDWRALLVVLVVAGHVFGTASRYVAPSNMGWYDAVFKVIYSFHMPAFFMLAGLMTSCASQKAPFACEVAKLVKRLLVPYFCFGTFSVMAYIFGMQYYHAASVGATWYYDGFSRGEWWHALASLLYGAPFPYTDGFRCNSVLWFLPCLFSVKLVGRMLSRLTGNLPTMRCVTIAAVAALTGWALHFVRIPPLPYGLLNVPWFLFFFLAGVILRPHLLRTRQNITSNVQVRRPWAVLLMALLFLSLLWLVPDITYSVSSPHWYAVVLMLGMLGSFLSIVAAKHLPIRWHVASRILSANAIGIMFLHKYFVLAMVMCCPVVKRCLASSLCFGIMLSIFIVIASTAAACMLSALLGRFAPWMIGRIGND